MIKPAIEYVNVTAPDANYPYGSAKESTTSTSRDGTPFGKALLNDLWGMKQAGVKGSGSAAALAGGLTAGMMYRTAVGDVMIVY